MSTIAGMYFMRSAGAPGQDIQPPGCSVVDSETNLNLSEDDNTSCSASEMGCDLTTSASHNNNNNSNSSSNSRKNKRKNFKPRNITEYAGSDEEEGGGGDPNAVKPRHYNHHHPRNLSNRPKHNHNSISSSNNIPLKIRRSPVRQETDYNYEEDDEGDGDVEGDESEMVPSPDVDDDLEDNNMSSRNGDDMDEMDCTDDEGDGEFNDADDGDGPLDLSEVQNDSKRLWRKPNKGSLMSPLQSLNNNNLHDPSFMNNSHPVGNQDHHHINNNNIVNFPASMAMDLRLARNPELYEDGRSNDLMITSSTGSSSNSIHNLATNNNSTVLTDFAETTMKELLGLYGIAENLRQGKQPNSEMPGIHRQLESSGNPTKMILPENMARLLAAMQESVTAANSNVNASPPGGVPSSVASHHHLSHNAQSGSANSSPSLNAHLNAHHHHLSPLASFANINSLVQQSQISSPDSPGNSPSLQISGNHVLHNHIGASNDNQFSKNSSKNNKPSGKSPSGRGLTSFPVIREGLLGKGTGPVDYTRYVRRFSNSAECGFQQCRELNYREHFHCLDCADGGRVFVKKEEMIRHFKWHKKRDESLQHGFMRYSPMDDCSDRFRNCTHNRKQTHYHCLQELCNKVYISTSDVQMHANYHRKDSAIIQEGFQRFRAAEDCGAEHCGFRHQRTTHFHCRRTSCSYTFKNKADMEKHKSYHIKDEQLNRDGFKKFMKHEACHYANCRFSRVCNHIHCIREGCNYVLHSSGQLYSHKRKHERRDSELAYRKFKLAQSVMRGTFGPDMSSLAGMSESLLVKSEEENSRSSINDQGDLDTEDIVKKFIQQCKCDVTDDEHFHCKVESCVNALLGTAEVASEHSRNHELEDRISSLAFFTVDPANFDAQDSTIPCISAKCPYQTKEKHFHCLWDGCTEGIILGTDDPFKRLEHFKAHQYSQKMDISDKGADSLDGFFRRKRGRPPKNRMIEVSSGANEAIFTSFKLPKPILAGSGGEGADNSDSDLKDPIGFLSYPEGTTCPDTSCSFNLSTPTCHYHCGHPRCHFSVADVHKLSLHLRDFHSNVDILDGYEYFERNSDCRDSNCEFNNNSDHFHCTRDGYTFVRYTSMMSHEAECHETKSNASSDEDEGKQWSGQVKASGTFYPLSSLNKNQKTNNNCGDAMDLSGSNGVAEQSESKTITDHSLSRILQLPVPETGETQYGPDAACGRPFCKLKRKHHFHCHLCNQAFSELEKLRPHVLKHNNFSPLKIADQSDQSTDEENSNKNDSDDQSVDRELQLQKQFILKKEEINCMKMEGSGGSIPPSPFNAGALQNFLGYPGSHSPYLFLQQNPLTSLYAGMMFGGSPGGFPPGSVLSPPPIPPQQLPPAASGLNDNGSPSPIVVNNSLQINKQSNIKRPPSASSSSPSSPPDGKKARLQLRILKDEPVPDGYIRFRFNEDCAYVHCGYREHQTHFHCTREDCGYSFCDKTRFVQHTARHERLDTLMGQEFKQFRANIPCGRVNCAYIPNTGSTQGQNKASHFHCSKCDFVCTDTNKVVAHRRQHQKLDSIMAAGFEKFTPSQHCHIEACIHAQKQTHYHCLKCSYAVLGLSQMSAHKYRHVD